MGRSERRSIQGKGNGVTRQRLTKHEYAVLFLQQNGRCGCGCGERLEAGKVDEEHSIPVAFDGPAKPDSLWRRDCHKRKTKIDIKAIAKTNRIQKKLKGAWRPNRKKIPSRGFDKSLSKKLSGEVIRRKTGE